MLRYTKTSLRGKILKTSVLALLVLAVLLGTISVLVVDRLSEEDSKKIMLQLCEREALKFDNKMNLVRHSVEIIYEYAEELRELQSDIDVYFYEYERHIKEFAVAVANKTDGARTVYFRYNPEITKSGTGGFLWSKRSDSPKFQEEIPTDILNYSPDDVGHVGWFYIPKKEGKPLWMNPYYNKNLKVFMISYIIPVYLENGEFVGVIGMDIDFKTIINEVSSEQIYESGYVEVVDLKERLIYYSDEDGKVLSESIRDELYNHIIAADRDNELLEVRNRDGSKSVICDMKLSNGMLIYVNVPKCEINCNRDFLILISMLITVLIFVVSSVVILKRTKSIVYPLERLTEITKQYAEGDWSVQYISDTGDEVQKLSESISEMAENTQDYIEILNNMAHTDAVTGLGNKTSYLEMVTRIKRNKHKKYNEYAVVVMDLNLLKKTNDTYGHEAGDMLIKEAAEYISSSFKGSPVFRTGGDEFAAILYGAVYKKRGELLDSFENNMNYSLPDFEKVILSVSFGMAEYPAEGSDYESVFEIADERMYQKKTEMKLGRQV
ncbi:MAG: diguanylate cyclase [Lachnospiraceae bacterium]|nr:diguanylate cyclase [Lachnospiraceae bacterium]